MYLLLSMDACKVNSLWGCHLSPLRHLRCPFSTSAHGSTPRLVPRAASPAYLESVELFAYAIDDVIELREKPETVPITDHTDFGWLNKDVWMCDVWPNSESNKFATYPCARFLTRFVAFLCPLAFGLVLPHPLCIPNITIYQLLGIRIGHRGIGLRSYGSSHHKRKFQLLISCLAW